MKIDKRIIITALTSIIMLTFLCSSVNAVTGFQGYAIYRDGTYDFWHAGMMDGPYSTSYLPVLHHSGSGYVKRDSWENFLSGNEFQGVYRPNSDPSSYYRDLFVALGRDLKDEQISYNAFYQVNYDSGSAGTWVDPEDISSIRCDGVVEYIYEWYGFRVYGSDTLWDVTYNSNANRNHHSGTAITPVSQTGYLTLIQDEEPVD